MVTARPAERTGPIIHSFQTASGLYAFQGLPGLHDIEYPVEDFHPGTSPPDIRQFIIEVKDPQGEFLTTVFSVDLPLPYEGIYPNAAYGSPPKEGPPGFYLFSAPTRSASPGFAAVRGQLISHDTGNPAAYAVLEVQIKGKAWYGVSDERGCIVVLFPFPSFNSMLGVSPPSANQIPLQQQHWELAIRVRHAPENFIFPYGSNFPELRSIWKQSPGVIWPDQAGPAVAEWPADLIFGQELVLRTEGLPESVLWIDKGV